MFCGFGGGGGAVKCEDDDDGGGSALIINSPALIVDLLKACGVCRRIGVFGGARGVLKPTQLLSTSDDDVAGSGVAGSYFVNLQTCFRLSRFVEEMTPFFFGVFRSSFLTLLVILSLIARSFSLTGFLIDSLNVEFMEVIEEIDALGSTELRRDRNILVSGVLIDAAKLILRRRFFVIEPVRVSFGFLLEPPVGTANESVEAKETLSKLSSVQRLRLKPSLLKALKSVPPSSSTKSSSSSSSAIRCNSSDSSFLAIGEMSLGFMNDESSFLEIKMIPSLAITGDGSGWSSICSSRLKKVFLQLLFSTLALDGSSAGCVEGGGESMEEGIMCWGKLCPVFEMICGM